MYHVINMLKNVAATLTLGPYLSNFRKERSRMVEEWKSDQEVVCNLGYIANFQYERHLNHSEDAEIPAGRQPRPSNHTCRRVNVSKTPL
jgi:hypothetical protein